MTLSSSPDLAASIIFLDVGGGGGEAEERGGGGGVIGGVGWGESDRSDDLSDIVKS